MNTTKLYMENIIWRNLEVLGLLVDDHGSFPK